MANDLTGDFDVVAEFSLPAVNRLLAAMHAIKRFPHSIALRVDDIPRSGPVRPSVLEIVDVLGDPVVEPTRIRIPGTKGGQSATTGIMFARLDGIVNTEVEGIFVPPTVPSRLQGRAQLQLAPPTLRIADAAAARISVRMAVKARYFADRNTPPAAEFARGDIVLTTSVNQITSQAGSVVDIDLRSDAVQASFVPAWSSRPLSAEDRAGIDLLIGNALKSSVLPSNTTLPAGIRSMQFKPMAAAPQAIAILLNTTSAPGNPGTVQRVFLGSDDFAFAVGADSIQGALQPALDKVLSTPIPPRTISIDWYPDPTYSFRLNGAAVELRAGRILLTIAGRATTPAWYAPNFNFTLKQLFGLQPHGSSADLTVGELTLDTDSWLVNRFRNRMRGPMASAINNALAQSGVQASVRRMLDAERNLGGFLRSLLTPARPDGQPQPQPLGVSLSYSSAEISPSGIVLRGTLAVAAWSPAHVEFEEIAVAGGGPLGGLSTTGPEYSGFKSWIAGGVIRSYEWRRAGQSQPGFQDENKFVRQPEGPVIVDGGVASEAGAPGPVLGYEPMCLTIRGARLAASGAVVPQPVTASYCAFQWFPLFDAARIGQDDTPLVALTRPGLRGEVEVLGHAPAVGEGKGRATPNLIVHFGDAGSPAQLERVTEALRKCGRADAATAIVAVLQPGEMERARYVAGVVYAEQQDDAWERLWGVRVARRPATFVIAPSGKVVWEQAGDIDASALADALRRELVPNPMLRVSTVTPGVRIGHAPPNFLFSPAAGSELTLRKLAGRPVILVFWKSTARCSLDTACALASGAPESAWQGGIGATGATGATGAIVLAINDGESKELGGKAAAGARLSATVVPDPARSISRAYGVSAWPTVVFIDALGVVREVRHGRLVTDGAGDVQQRLRPTLQP